MKERFGGVYESVGKCRLKHVTNMICVNGFFGKVCELVTERRSCEREHFVKTGQSYGQGEAQIEN